MSEDAIAPTPLQATPAEYDELEATLLNTSGEVPLAKRFRALFTLRNLKSHRAIDIIGQGGCTLFALRQTSSAVPHTREGDSILTVSVFNPIDIFLTSLRLYLACSSRLQRLFRSTRA